MMPWNGHRFGCVACMVPRNVRSDGYLKTRSEPRTPSQTAFLCFSPPTSAQEPTLFQFYSHCAAFTHDHRSHLFDSNIQPIRAILRSGNESDNAKLGIFPWQPWRATKTAAVEEATSKVPNSPSTTMNKDDSIARILQFPPLLDAFDGFCRKALCSEVGGLSRIKSRHWSYTVYCAIALLKSSTADEGWLAPL